MNRRDFVRISLGSGLLARIGAAQETRAARAKAAILLWLAGAPSQLETFDPHEGSVIPPVETAVAGVRISSGLPRIARQMKQVSLVRSLHSRDPNHATAAYLLHTGWRRAAGLQHPHIGSVLTRELGDRGEIPGCVVVGGDPQCGAGYLPAETGPVVFDRLDAPTEDVKPSTSRERLERRWKMLSSLDRRFAEERAAEAVEERRRSTERAYRLLTSEKVKAFDLSREAPGRYGTSPFGRACQLARRLVEAGSRFVEVQLGDWDSHADLEPAHRRLLETLDGPWSALLADLADRRMLDETLVIVMGEFGRTPDLNRAAGRDHWTRAWSAALSGGGISGGRVVGATDGREVTDRPVTVPDFFATICRAFGVDPRKEVDALGRPLPLVDGGKPVLELF
ncbi:MAG TPA: DUF1501 domain-containing protein [Planctomycetota bacterium]|nr:DUF1501 domain-containing protein [Planctomycetota bacterium]